ncbi:MAG: SPFH/Band 7/PHB domain protein [Chloroflexi bacterium]|nr:SPFH/Band 7/PHB domain protein [Chloroflexota bacterium]
MSAREKLIFLVGRFLVVAALGLWLWLILPFAAWYVKNIPDKKKNLPFTSWLRVNLVQKDGKYVFFDWLSGFLISWWLYSLGWTVGFGLILGFGAFLPVLAPIYDAVGNLTLGYVAIILGTGYFGFNQAKSYNWDYLLIQAEPTARALLGPEFEKLTEDEKKQLYRHCADVEAGINKGTWLVAGGRSELKHVPADSFAKFGGPGVLVVQEGHAVVLERSGRISRIEGAGFYQLAQYERPHFVVYLPVRTEKVQIGAALTRDKMVIKNFNLMVFHRADRGNQSASSGQYRYDPELIRTLIWSPKGQDWPETVKSVADSAGRDVIGRYHFEDLVSISDESRRRLTVEFTECINKVTKALLGIEVVATNIGAITLSDDATNALEAKNISEIRRQTMVTDAEAEKEAIARKGEGQALAIRHLEQEKAAIRRELLQQLMEPLRAAAGGQPLSNADIAKRYLDAVEHLLEKLETSMIKDDLDAIRYIEALDKIASATGQKTFIVGDPRGAFPRRHDAEPQ